MACNFHIRSNSLPSKSHPTINDIENHLCRLRDSETTSTSATSICSNLANLKDLNEDINNLMQLPSIQQAFSNEKGEKWITELLDESLGLVDLCGFAREVVDLVKESVQELQSSIRRNRSETATSDDMKSYMASRKNITKRVNKFIKKNIKSFNQTTILDKNDDLKVITGMLKETEAFGFSVLRSVLILVSEQKEKSNQRSWSFLSRLSTQSSHQELCSLKQLKASEMIAQEIEEELEAFFRCLVKTRVSILNVLNH